MDTKIKICGVRTIESALVAHNLSVDFIGLVYVPDRKRCIDSTVASTISSMYQNCLNPKPKIVGIVADQPLREVNHLIKVYNLDIIQLSGNEDLDYCNSLNTSVIKTIYVKQGRDEELGHLESEIETFRTDGHIVTLDRHTPKNRGGQGLSFDWEIAKALSDKGHQFILSGGRTPKNVTQAINRVQPWGVDISSGVETDDAQDHEKIKLFVKNVRNASCSTPPVDVL